jgi:hypothetical protein
VRQAEAVRSDFGAVFPPLAMLVDDAKDTERSKLRSNCVWLSRAGAAGSSAETQRRGRDSKATLWVAKSRHGQRRAQKGKARSSPLKTLRNRHSRKLRGAIQRPSRPSRPPWTRDGSNGPRRSWTCSVGRMARVRSSPSTTDVVGKRHDARGWPRIGSLLNFPPLLSAAWHAHSHSRMCDVHRATSLASSQSSMGISTSRRAIGSQCMFAPSVRPKSMISFGQVKSSKSSRD